MDMKRTMSLTDARKNIFALVDDVATTQAHYVLTENGRPKAVLLSAEQFEAWQETLETLEENPNLEQELKIAKTEYEQGSFVNLERFLRSRGLMVSDLTKTYGTRKTKK